MNAWNAVRVAEVLLDAEATATARGSIEAEWSDLDLGVAYAAQDEALSRRQERGERIVGVKLGLTSRAKQIQMGVDSPSVAWLTDAMALPAGAPVPRARLIHPRAEPEIVFVMRDRLAGPGVTAAAALAAVDRVYAGIEIIDSRYAGFRFTLADAVADNNSSGVYVTGPVGVRPEDLTSHSRRSCWRSTVRSSTAPPARPFRAIRPRRWPSPLTPWPTEGTRSRPAGPCSPGA